MNILTLDKQKNFIHSLAKLPPQEQAIIIQHLSPESVSFLTKCFACILNGNSSHLHLDNKQLELARKLWKPYEKSMRILSETANHDSIAQQICNGTDKCKQRKLFTSILAGSTPLLEALTRRALKKNKDTIIKNKNKKRKVKKSSDIKKENKSKNIKKKNKQKK